MVLVSETERSLTLLLKAATASLFSDVFSSPSSSSFCLTSASRMLSPSRPRSSWLFRRMDLEEVAVSVVYLLVAGVQVLLHLLGTLLVQLRTLQNSQQQFSREEGKGIVRGGGGGGKKRGKKKKKKIG